MRPRPQQSAVPALAITAIILGLILLVGLWCAERQQEYTGTAIQAYFAAPSRPVQQSRNIRCPQAPPPEMELASAPMLHLTTTMPEVIEAEDFFLPEQEPLLLLSCELSEAAPKKNQTTATTRNSTSESLAPLIPPSPESAPAPPYPAQLRAARRSGHVQARIHVDATGKPTRVDIVSSTHPAFATAAQECILKHWCFVPAHRSNIPVASTVLQTIHFRM